MGKNKNHSKIKEKVQKANTNKIISKILHNAKKETPRQMRQRLEKRKNNPAIYEVHPDKLKFGSINVDGLDLQTDAALRDLLSAREFDVSIVRHVKFRGKGKENYQYLETKVPLLVRHGCLKGFRIHTINLSSDKLFLISLVW